MQKIIQLFLACILAFSSAFFVDTVLDIKKAEARCPMGYYIDQDAFNNSSKCKKASFTADDSKVEKESKSMITVLANTIAALLLAGSLISFIYAGYQYITFGINSQNAEKAKERLINTGMAIILILSAYSIYRIFASIFL